jgi:hypothetical protein
MNDRHFSNFHIAGLTYYDAVDVFEELRVGKTLILKAEPENPFDGNAVAIYYGETKLGYIPASQNEQFSKLLRFGHGDIFEAKISQRNEEAHPEKQIRVLIRIKDKMNEQ